MAFDAILVKELREEHRDREWVDQHRTHWIWCEDTWVRWDLPPDFSGWVSASDKRWLPDDPNAPVGYDNLMRGPFMEAMHHRLLWG